MLSIAFERSETDDMFRRAVQAFQVGDFGAASAALQYTSVPADR
jgi:hypothetical protein